MNVEPLNSNPSINGNDNISVTNLSKKDEESHVSPVNSKETNIFPKPINLLETDLVARNGQQEQVQSNWLEQMLSSDDVDFNYEFCQREVNEHFKDGIRNGDQLVNDLVEFLDVATITIEEDGGRQLYKITSIIRAMLSFKESLFTKKQLENIIKNSLDIVKTHPGNGTFKSKALTAAFGILSEIICGYKLNSNTIENIKKVLLLEYQQTRIPSIRRNARNLLFDVILNCGLQGLSIRELVMEFSLKDVYFLINEALDVCRNEKDLQKAKNVLGEIIHACLTRGDVFPTLAFGELPAGLNETLSAEDEAKYKKAFEELETAIKLATPSLLLPSAHLGIERKISNSEIQDIDNRIAILECSKDGDAEQLSQAKAQLANAIFDLQNKNQNWQILTNFVSEADAFLVEGSKSSPNDLKDCWNELKKNVLSSKKTEIANDPFSKNVKQFRKLLNNFGNLTEKERDELTRLWNELRPILSGNVDWTLGAVQHIDNFLESNNTDVGIKSIWEMYPKNAVKAFTYAIDAYRGQDLKLEYWLNMKSAIDSFKDLVAIHECDPKTYVKQELGGSIIECGAVSGGGKYHNNCCFLSILDALKEKFPNGVNGRQISDIWPDAEDLRTGAREFIWQGLTEDQQKEIKELEKQEKSAVTNEEKKNIQSKIVHIVGNYGRDFIDLRSGNQVFCNGIFSEYISSKLGTPIAIAAFEDGMTQGTSHKIPGNISVSLPTGAGSIAVIKNFEVIQPFVELAVKSNGAIQNGEKITTLTLYHDGSSFTDEHGVMQNHGHYQKIKFNQKQI